MILWMGTILGLLLLAGLARWNGGPSVETRPAVLFSRLRFFFRAESYFINLCGNEIESGALWSWLGRRPATLRPLAR
jgi:hypothetical protein